MLSPWTDACQAATKSQMQAAYHTCSVPVQCIMLTSTVSHTDDFYKVSTADAGTHIVMLTYMIVDLYDIAK